MYCPKCASRAVEGQRFCRQCGANLGIIVDAMEGKRGPLDFDSLKEDLRQLGQSLRSSFEEASREIKKTKRHQHRQWRAEWGLKSEPEQAADTGSLSRPVSTRPIPIKIRRVRGGSSRRHSLQQGLLSIFGGGAMSATLYFFLNTAADSGLLFSLEQLILRETGAQVVGLVPVFQALWMLGLIPVAKGVAHLINGIIFPARPTEDPADVVVQEINQRLAAAQAPQPYVSPTAADEPAPASDAPDTDELNRDPEYSPLGSVTEDTTVRFDSRTPERARDGS